MRYQSSQINKFAISAFKSPFSVGVAALLFAAGLTFLSTAAAAGTRQKTMLASITAQAPTTATVIYVNPNSGTDSSGAGKTEAAPVKTITYALTQAQPGTVIQLASGNYTAQTGEVFPLDVKQGVTLRGDPATKGQNIVIFGGGNYISPAFARQNIAVRAENDSVIIGVTISNPNTRGTALWIESTNPTVENNTFTKNNREGIFVLGTAAPKIESNVFTKNQGNGISVAGSAQGEIRNNLFQDTGFGLAIGGKSSPMVTENQIVQNKDGLFIDDSASPVLRSNTIKNNTQDGIVITLNGQPDLGTADNPGQNIIRSNGKYDVRNATSNTIVAVANDIDKKHILGKVDFVAAQVAFQDIQAGYWAQPYIKALAAKKIIAGFPNGTFKPDEPVTRAQFAAIINKAFSPTVQRPPLNFTDVSKNFWAHQPIESAYQGGFMTGYPGGAFKPDQQIPRVQVLVSLANGLNLPAGNSGALSVYADASQIPNYAATQVAAATARQLVINYPTPSQLNPNQPATRAQVAAFVYQALVNAGRAQAISSPYVVKLPSQGAGSGGQ
ncbi:MAG: DUF1565 domain-containing protein [Chroococcidiopsidaceae cyanobacterium CP_BM_RX_35]|nr:DUF1565 domain-containing protein [Chroococcidiopsidaceae cyanobacterium CP_BM_RX_35]